jgi:NitT/TauT family transport system substrate-binding protein
VLYASAEWVQKRRETAARLARAIKRTLVWLQAHTPQEIADRTPADFRGDDPGLYADALKNTMAMFSPDGVMEADGAEAVHALLAQSMDKVRGATIDLSKTYTNELVNGR